MKKMICVAQSKGGAGKSVLAFLLAEKYKDAGIVDMDDATKTTTKQLAYRNPVYAKFLNSNNTIDRGLFSKFYENVSEVKRELIICDIGASVSEQLPYYFQDVSDVLPEVLQDLEIDLEIYCVIGGGNIFSATMEYLEELVKSVNNNFLIKVFKNEYYHFDDSQNKELEAFAKDKKVKIYSFNVSKDINESTQKRIKDVLKSGQGIDSASPFTKMYFKKAINNLQV